MRAKVAQMGEITRRKLAEITCYRTTAHAGQEIFDIDGSTDYEAWRQHYKRRRTPGPALPLSGLVRTFDLQPLEFINNEWKEAYVRRRYQGRRSYWRHFRPWSQEHGAQAWRKSIHWLLERAVFSLLFFGRTNCIIPEISSYLNNRRSDSRSRWQAWRNLIDYRYLVFQVYKLLTFGPIFCSAMIKREPHNYNTRLAFLYASLCARPRGECNY